MIFSERDSTPFLLLYLLCKKYMYVYSCLINLKLLYLILYLILNIINIHLFLFVNKLGKL